MKVKSKITTLAILAAATCAADATQRKITVCVDTPTWGISRAQAQASEMFAAIGMKLEWRCPKSGTQGTIAMSLATNTPESQEPGALAYAFFGGTHIVIFYDRIRKMVPNQVSSVLAHVMVHEVTHILQGIPRHSESGVMKAHWDAGDYLQMTWNPLPFSDEDVTLIERGWAARGARLAGAPLPALKQVQ